MRELALNAAMRGLDLMVPAFQVALVLSVLVLLPLSVIRRTRRIGGAGLIAASWVIGLTAWLLGAIATFASFGWFGLIVGLVVLGVGVVPMGIAGAFFSLDAGGMAAAILAMTVAALAARLAGAHFLGLLEA